MSDVCVVGLGKLGSVLATVLASKGHQVIGLDVSEDTVDKVNIARAPVTEAGLQNLMIAAADNLSATTSPAVAVKKSSIAFIVVPTPSDDDDKFTNRYILEAIDAMGPYVNDWYTFVVCSTVMPGSVNGPITERLEEVTGRKVGESIGLCYSPEFIALGSVVWDMTHPDAIFLGADDHRSRSDLYSVLSGVSESEWTELLNLSIVDAEIAKIAVNTYVTMKISYANMLAEICEKVPGADAWKVAQAVGTDSRIGVKYLQPGGAYGGPCFPRDTKAFAVLAEESGTQAELADATNIINRRQSVRVADACRSFSRVAVLGKSYKPGTPVTENSFAVDVIRLLQFEGVRVAAYDPYVSQDVEGSESVVSAQDAVDRSEAVIIATAYQEFAGLNYGDRFVLDVWNLVPDGPNVRRVGIAW